MQQVLRSGLFVVLISALSLTSATLLAGSELPGKSVMVTDPWSRPAPPVAVNGAAYVALHNMGPEQDRLIGARSEIADMVQIHDHVMSNGLMKMRHLEAGISLDSGEMVQLKPGGKHLMLMGLNSPLVDGESFQLILQFEKAGEKSVTVEIQERSADSNHDSHSGSHSMEQGG